MHSIAHLFLQWVTLQQSIFIPGVWPSSPRLHLLWVPQSATWSLPLVPGGRGIRMLGKSMLEATLASPILPSHPSGLFCASLLFGWMVWVLPSARPSAKFWIMTLVALLSWFLRPGWREMRLRSWFLWIILCVRSLWMPTRMAIEWFWTWLQQIVGMARPKKGAPSGKKQMRAPGPSSGWSVMKWIWHLRLGRRQKVRCRRICVSLLWTAPWMARSTDTFSALCPKQMWDLQVALWRLTWKLVLLMSGCWKLPSSVANLSSSPRMARKTEAI